MGRNYCKEDNRYIIFYSKKTYTLTEFYDIFQSMDISIVNKLDDRQIEKLHRLFQNERWTKERTVADIQEMLNHSVVKKVPHVELYCPEKLFPFYQKLGFEQRTSLLLRRK